MVSCWSSLLFLLLLFGAFVFISSSVRIFNVYAIPFAKVAFSLRSSSVAGGTVLVALRSEKRLCAALRLMRNPQLICFGLEVIATTDKETTFVFFGVNLCRAIATLYV